MFEVDCVAQWIDFFGRVLSVVGEVNAAELMSFVSMFCGGVFLIVL